MQRNNSKYSKKSNCMNYGQNRTLNCSSRRHCVDKCINRKYFERHSRIPMHSVIDEHDLIDSKRLDSKFSIEKDFEIEQQCMNEFSRIDCTEVIFHETLKTSYNFERKSIWINLNFQKDTEIEAEESLVKVILNIINLWSIFFGSTATNVLLTLSLLVKQRFRLKWSKFYRYVVFAVCLIGVSIHNLSVFHGIIKDDLVESGHFQKLRSYNIPNVIFCVKYNENAVDENHKLTGKIRN